MQRLPTALLKHRVVHICLVFQYPQAKIFCKLLQTRLLLGGLQLTILFSTTYLYPANMPMLSRVKARVPVVLLTAMVANSRSMISQVPQTQRMSAELMMAETLHTGFLSPEDMHILR